jgi:hypothetical protein
MHISNGRFNCDSWSSLDVKHADLRRASKDIPITIYVIHTTQMIEENRIPFSVKLISSVYQAKNN